MRAWTCLLPLLLLLQTMMMMMMMMMVTEARTSGFVRESSGYDELGVASGKKGVGLGPHHTLCTDMDAAAGGLGNVEWWYDWGHKKEAFASCSGEPLGGREYVPMIFDLNSLKTPHWAQTVAELAEHAFESRFIFGYNEPETHMDPREAAAYWIDAELLAEEFSFQLTSPCMVNYDERAKAWLSRFVAAFQASHDRPPRFDFMCLHAYFFEGHESIIMERIEEMAADYGRRVWLNEFACTPWEGCAADLQLKLMQKLLPLLTASPSVFRFAWFDARYNRPPPDNECSLLQEGNVTRLTPLGEYYNSAVLSVQ